MKKIKIILRGAFLAVMVVVTLVVMVFERRKILPTLPIKEEYNKAKRAPDKIFLTSEQFWTKTQPNGSESSSSLATLTADHNNGPPPANTWLVGSAADDDADTTITKPLGQKIPKQITKVFLQKKGDFLPFSQMPKNLIAAHKSWEAKNQNYTLRYYDLNSARQYLHTYYHPVFLRAFDCIEAFAGKADLFRAAVVYREGGWYSDWKQLCLQDNLLENLSMDRDLVLFNEIHHGTKRQKRLQNAFFGAVPQHPVLEEQLKRILNHIQSSNHGVDVYHTAGPGVLFDSFYSLQAKNLTKPNSIVGTFIWPGELFVANNGTELLLHKCEGCSSSGAKWPTGNNYYELWRNKQYYCQDAANLFQAQTYTNPLQV